MDQAQLLSHLRLLNLQVGLLINFHVAQLKDGIRRLVNNYREELDDGDGTDHPRGGRLLTAEFAEKIR